MAEEKKAYTIPKEAHASELLASERTFLAWVRTSVAVIGFGFALIKFDVWIRQSAAPSANAIPKTGLTVPIGGLMVLTGGLLAAFGAWHYRVTNRQIERGEVKANDRLIFAASGLVVTIALFILIYLISSGELF